METYPNTIKLSKYAIKTAFKNHRSIHNFGNIPLTAGKSARWVSEAFSFTKEKTQKLSKNKALKTDKITNFLPNLPKKIKEVFCLKRKETLPWELMPNVQSAMYI